MSIGEPKLPSFAETYNSSPGANVLCLQICPVDLLIFVYNLYCSKVGQGFQHLSVQSDM